MSILSSKIFSRHTRNVNTTNNKIIEKQPKTEDDELLDFSVKACSQKIAESAERYVPEYNKFSPHSINFVIPGTSNIAVISIKHDEKNYKTQRRVLIGVHHKNSDALVSNYVFKGTKAEVLNYLKTLSDDNLDQTVETIKELSKKSDKRHLFF